MKKSSRYYELRWLVQCRQSPGSTFERVWQTIAAFDGDVLAENYSHSCAAFNKFMEYRVVNRDDKSFKR